MVLTPQREPFPWRLPASRVSRLGTARRFRANRHSQLRRRATLLRSRNPVDRCSSRHQPSGTRVFRPAESDLLGTIDNCHLSTAIWRWFHHSSKDPLFISTDWNAYASYVINVFRKITGNLYEPCHAGSSDGDRSALWQSAPGAYWRVRQRSVLLRLPPSLAQPAVLGHLAGITPAGWSTSAGSVFSSSAEREPRPAASRTRKSRHSAAVLVPRLDQHWFRPHTPPATGSGDQRTPRTRYVDPALLVP